MNSPLFLSLSFAKGMRGSFKPEGFLVRINYSSQLGVKKFKTRFRREGKIPLLG